MKKILHADIRIWLLAASMILGIFTSVVIHELGHSATCSYFGYDSPITIDPMRSYVLCKATGVELDYVHLAGGGSAAVLFLLVLVPSAIRHNDYTKMFLMSGCIVQLFNVIWETFFNESYDGGARAIMLITTVVIIVILKWRMFLSQKNLNNFKKRFRFSH